MQNILIYTDLKDNMTERLRLWSFFHRINPNKIVVHHAYKIPNFSNSKDIIKQHDEIKSKAQHEMDFFRKSIKELYPKSELITEISLGDASNTITRTAEKHKIDTIISSKQEIKLLQKMNIPIQWIYLEEKIS